MVLDHFHRNEILLVRSGCAEVEPPERTKIGPLVHHPLRIFFQMTAGESRHTVSIDGFRTPDLQIILPFLDGIHRGRVFSKQNILRVMEGHHMDVVCPVEGSGIGNVETEQGRTQGPVFQNPIPAGREYDQQDGY